MSILNYLVSKEGGGWFGYRGLFAILLASPQIGLFAYWVTYQGVSLSASMFYLTLLPMIAAIPLISLLPGKSGLTAKKIAIFAIWALLAYTLYDWARVPMNIFFGIPFWDHWFDWGASILGSQGTIFTYQNLTTGLLTHILRGWGFAMAYYILVKRVTLVSTITFAWFMTVFYWIVFPVFVLTDALPPWIWWFTAWESHMAYAIGLWLAPKLITKYRKPSPEEVSEESKIPAFKRSRKTTLYAILATQGFGLVIGSLLFGAIVGGQPPSTYPVFGYGKPPPILIDGLHSYYWAIPGAILAFVFLYLMMRSQKKEVASDSTSYT